MDKEQKEREEYLKEIGIDQQDSHPEMDGNADNMKILRYVHEIMEECERRKYSLEDIGILVYHLQCAVQRNTEIIRNGILFKAHVQPRDRYQVAGHKCENYFCNSLEELK